MVLKLNQKQELFTKTERDFPENLVFFGVADSSCIGLTGNGRLKT
ncbi:uncharacterized protein METZ01_LOCUS281536 [marine metagenome]|uniref:Uncharacterized protein n=1 Tax=marine metagenome TaxID=408172 RepID=A0A382L033_9ZZZZ